MSRHPSEAQWRQYFAQRLSAESARRMHSHLLGCDDCLDLYHGLEPPVYRALGRPVVAFLPFGPREIEICVEDILTVFAAKRAAAEPVVIAAGWPLEGLLLHVLSLTHSRLRNRGFSTAVCGVAYGSPVPPDRPGTDVALLPGASNYPSLGEWIECSPNRTAVLGIAVEDSRRGAFPMQPDIVLDTPRPEDAQRALRSKVEAMEQALAAGGVSQSGVLSCALGCDPPWGFFPPGAASPLFPHIEDPLTGEPLPWSSLDGGQWLAWEVVQRVYAGRSAALAADLQSCVARLLSLGAAGSAVATRLTRRAMSYDLPLRCTDLLG